MEMEQGSVESIETTEAPETGATGEEDAAEGHELEQAEYKPDYKYKFYGKEAEMEEWARQYIKDKETEDRFRSLYAKSNGFDVLRERYQSKESEFNEFQGQYQEIESRANQLEDTLQEIKTLRETDLDGLFRFIGVTPDKLIDYVEQHLAYLQKPENERAVYDKAREESMRARELEKQNQQLQMQFQQQTQQAHESEFESYMEHPEVEGFASQYDSLVGKPGAFRQAVQEYGEFVFHKKGEYVKPLDAIRAVYRQYKPFVARAGGTSSQGGDGEEAQVSREQQPRQRPATIPNLGGGAATSPTRKVFGSLDELKKHVKAITAED